jgi:hypothetical protein|nr:MAG TPA: hypothetical protein [Caudoviricetes sp.]
MDNIVYSATVEGLTFEDIKKIQEMFERNSDPRVDISPYYQQEIKERILLVEMQKAREHLQELCDNAYGKGNRVIMVSSQKSI